MPNLIIPNTFINGTVADATQVNTNFTAVATVVNALDFNNVGTLGFYASQIIPTSGPQATFGGSQVYTFPNGLSVAAGGAAVTGGISSTAAVTALGGGATAAGFNTSTASGMGVKTGLGVPSYSAPNGTLFLRYDGGSGSSLYVNTSGASTSGVTWSSVVQAGIASAQGSSIVTYATTGSENAGTPGVMATATLTLPSSSPGANSNWRVFVTLTVQRSDSGWASSVVGVGTAGAGTTPYPLFNATATTHTITGGNCVSDATAPAAGKGVAIVTYSAIYANSASLSFTGLLGSSISGGTINGQLAIQAFAN